MDRQPQSTRLHIVVDVWRGIAVGAHAYRKKTDATRRLRQISRGRNLDEDDVRMFTATVRCAKPQKRTRRAAFKPR
jgi:hypothetical protein